MTALHAQAQAAGLHVEWQDAGGVDHVVGDDTLTAILAALDAPDDAAPSATDDNAPPRRCPALPPGTHAWGAAVQIPSLRDVRASAFGDFGTLADAARALGRHGAQALGISPVHALFPADTRRISPYAPSSRLFLNIWLADPALIGAPFSAEAAPDLIDWQGALPARMAHLRAAWSAAPDGVRDAVSAFRAQRGAALGAHALFDALHARFFAQTGAAGWQDWPTDYRDPGSAAVQRFAAEHADDIGFHVFLQWLADTGLAAAQAAARETMAIGLIADLAVGVDAGGSQTWSRRGDFLTGLTIGAPPDPLGPDGQNWGITAFSPFALRRADCAPFAETIRAVLAHAGGLRVDHALGLGRLWVIPEGARPGDGAYLTMPLAAMLDTLAVEAQRAGAIVIGEDLGTVPPGFRDTLRARGILGMRVLPFERGADRFVPSSRWSADAVAMTGTHDTPTLAGWWCGRDIDWAQRLGRGGAQDDEATQRAARDTDRAALWRAYADADLVTGAMPDDAAPAVDAGLRFAAAAPAPLAMIPIEDLAGLEEQPNLPGTIDEHPNWRRRLPAASADLLAEPAVAARLAALSSTRPA